MKKLNLFFIFALIAGFGFAQSSHTIDFETNGTGADWEWITQGNADNPPLEFIDNPVSGGINNSDKVAKFTARQAGLGYAYTHTIDNGQFTFDQYNHIVRVMVYKPVVSPISIKFDGPGGLAEILVWNTQVNQWEELEFDFSGFIGNTYNRFRILPDYEDREEEHIIYLDNIQMPDGEVMILPEPTTVPPIPQHDEVDVISIYTEVYTNEPGTDFFPNWGQATRVTYDYPVAENNTLKYDYLDYQGTVIAILDISLFENFHIDLWTPNSTNLWFNFISEGGEESVEIPVTTEEWISLDIDLQNFTPAVDLSNVVGLGFTGNGTIYFDNWYLWKEPYAQGSDPTLSNLEVDGETVPGFTAYSLTYNVDLPYGTSDVPTTTATTTDPQAGYVVNDANSLPGTTTVEVTSANGSNTITYTINYGIDAPEPQVAAPNPTHPEEDVLSIYSDIYQNLEGVNFNPFWWQQTMVTIDYPIAGNNTLKYEDLDYQGTEFPSQDVTSYEYFHLDFWTSNSTNLQFYLISPGTEVYVDLPIILEEWVSVNINLQEFAPPVDLSNIFLFKIIGDGTVYFDNWYFWKLPTLITKTENTSTSLSIYPNPANDYITISNQLDLAKIEIFNVMGQPVKQISNPGSQIPVRDLPNGVYKIMATTKDGKRQIAKILKK